MVSSFLKRSGAGNKVFKGGGASEGQCPYSHQNINSVECRKKDFDKQVYKREAGLVNRALQDVVVVGDSQIDIDLHVGFPMPGPDYQDLLWRVEI